MGRGDKFGGKRPTVRATPGSGGSRSNSPCAKRTNSPARSRGREPGDTHIHRKGISVMSSLSYVHPTSDSPWGTYLSQVDRVVPYLGKLGRWAETLKHPKRALIVDVPIGLDNGTLAH